MVGRNLFANSTCSRMSFSASRLAFPLPLIPELRWIRLDVNKASLGIKTVARAVWELLQRSRSPTDCYKSLFRAIGVPKEEE